MRSRNEEDDCCRVLGLGGACGASDGHDSGGRRSCDNGVCRVPVYKEYGRDTLTFVNTVLTPRKGLFGMKTKVQPRTKTLVKQSVQMCARAANADHKIVKTGTWQWNTTVDRYEYGSASITYQDTVKMCSYGQARLKSGSALTGTFTVPASPARSY